MVLMNAVRYLGLGLAKLAVIVLIPPAILGFLCAGAVEGLSGAEEDLARRIRHARIDKARRRLNALTKREESR